MDFCEVVANCDHLAPDHENSMSVVSFDNLILTIRGEKVILNTDLARLYGVTVRRLNEQVKRNSDRFPEDFAFRLTVDEFNYLKSPIV